MEENPYQPPSKSDMATARLGTSRFGSYLVILSLLALFGVAVAGVLLIRFVATHVP